MKNQPNVEPAAPGKKGKHANHFLPNRTVTIEEDKKNDPTESDTITPEQADEN